MAELFGLTGTPDPVNDRVPFLDASETLANQLKDCSPRTLVNSGLELQANGDSTSAIVRHTSLGYITGHIPIASPDTLANSLPAGSITGTPVITTGASLLVQFVIASAIGANGYNIYKRRCGKSGVTNWRGVEGWELEAYSEFSGTFNLDLALGSWEIAVQTVSDLQTGPITYVFRTDDGTLSGSVSSVTIKQDTTGVCILPVVSGTVSDIHVFHRRVSVDGPLEPIQEDVFPGTDSVLLFPDLPVGETVFYIVGENNGYYSSSYVPTSFTVETPSVAEIIRGSQSEVVAVMDADKTLVTTPTVQLIGGWTEVKDRDGRFSGSLITIPVGETWEVCWVGTVECGSGNSALVTAGLLPVTSGVDGAAIDVVAGAVVDAGRFMAFASNLIITGVANKAWRMTLLFNATAAGPPKLKANSIMKMRRIS